MDEMKIQSAFMTGLISKVIRSALRKKTGYEIDVQINDIRVNVSDGIVRVHLDANAEIETDELMKIVKSID